MRATYVRLRGSPRRHTPVNPNCYTCDQWDAWGYVATGVGPDGAADRRTLVGRDDPTCAVTSVEPSLSLCGATTVDPHVRLPAATSGARHVYLRGATPGLSDETTRRRTDGCTPQGAHGDTHGYTDVIDPCSDPAEARGFSGTEPVSCTARCPSVTRWSHG